MTALTVADLLERIDADPQTDKAYRASLLGLLALFAPETLRLVLTEYDVTAEGTA